ncbi:hypothetical protein C2R22_12550 [Salinigranum rubrum]|uniref:Sucrose-phosphatase C-terminal domain-containing protein n=1 Tax=Salinigranum rubrum TaxID=755307 RepID=A0A2I8VKB0_9EURY|nr:DUF4440 domain-containing protein [Salinigranum rubrum]AUV82370.1 hypothetical protein C2R22_12550 [Salinigranum rubrum]
MTETDSSLVEQCRREVDELHAFFELWFVGELPQQRTELRRFEGVLAEDFRMIQPSGLTRSRDGIVADVFDAHGAHEDVTVETSTFEPRVVGETCLGTYEEWQTTGEERTGRVATVLFRRAEGTPNGVEWVHLHETWLAE